MEMYIPKSFRQIIAILLCMAMVLPMIPVHGYAAETADSTDEAAVATTVPATETTTEPVTEAPAEVDTEAPTEASAEVPADAPEEVLSELNAEVKTDAVQTNAVSLLKIADGISIPQYSGGTTSKTMEYDCGNGVTGKGEKSYLTIVTETDSDEFIAYKKLLADNGYVLKMEKDIVSDDASAPNRFASYVSNDGSYKLYTYHFPHYQETRIIVDTQDDTVEGFIYSPQSGETVKPMLAMYGLSMATNGYDGQLSTTNYTQGRRNCGALVVIRMPDNSLFIHDGGDIQQWSDNACDEFLAFCRKLTGVPEGEKMVINTWFLSHAHSDHFLGFPRFINKYHDQFDLKNIMYNIDIERTYTTRDIHAVMQLVGGHYPNVRYYKPHTGESFEIAGVKFDVMYAHEDRYLPTEDGDLITDYPTIVDGEATTAYDIGGTYRDYCYDDPEVKTSESDFNDTSTVLRVTFENGVNSILYADMNRVEQTLFDIYPDNALVGDIVMVPHHGFDSHPQLMAMSDATIFLYTQHKQAIYGPDDDYTTEESDKSVYRPRLRNNFIPMKEAIDETGAVEGKDYKFYWAGNNTVVIDINSMEGVAAAAETETEDFGMTLDTAAANDMGITVYTAEANDDVYSNAWTVYDLEDGTAAVSDANENLISVGDQTTVTKKEAGTVLSRFWLKTDAPEVGDSYLIRSDYYDDYIMSYSAVADTPGFVNDVTYFLQTEEKTITSTATNLFYEATVTRNNKDTECVYLDHSNRDGALLIIHQDGNTGTNVTKATDESYTTPLFGGTHVYSDVWFAKGTASDDAYWYAENDKDSGDTQYRFMNQRYAELFQNAAIAETNRVRYTLEFFGDGVYMIYWRSKGGETVRVLCYNETDGWHVEYYSDETDNDYPSVSEAKENVDKLKLRLYEYEEQSTLKTIDFSGPTTFNVEPGTTYEQILTYIQQNIAVDNTDRRNLAIPGNGGTAKVGYYWLDFGDATYDPNKAATYTVKVQYRNDDGSDTEITTLTVNVAGISVAGTTSYTVMEGASQAEVEAMIKNAITVTKTVGSQQSTVSYSSGAVAGKYWLDFNVPFDSTDGSKLYEVSVKYRNPGGSDVVAKTLTVQVLPLKLTFDGTKEYVVEEGVSESAVRSKIAESITVTRNTVNGGTETVSYAAAATAGSYWLEFDGAFNSAADGDHDYFVKVWYRNGNGTDTLVETLTVNVEQKIANWTAPADKVGTVPLNAGLTTVAQKVEGETSHNITFTVNGETRYVTVGLLTDASGKQVDTSKAGTYENLTLTYMGVEICDDFTLIVTASNDALDYPQKGQGGYVGVDKVSPTPNEEFKDTGVAEIQLSATGTPPEQGIDLIIIMDLSGSMLNKMNTNVDAEDYNDSRAVAMENALEDMIQMLAESGQDVTIAMSDFGDLDHNVFKDSVADESILHEAVFDINNDNGRYLSSSNENKKYEFTNQLNYVFRSGEATAPDANGNAVSKIGTFANVHTKFNMAHPQYTGMIVPTVYTGSGEAEADAFVDVSALYDGGFTDTWTDIIAQIDENAHSSIGTNYDIGLEYAYQLAYAKQQENIANGEGKERDIVCIFMSDGAAMQYNYFSGRSDNQSWSDFLLGTFDSIGSAGITAENVPPQLEEISGKMLEKLIAGTLTRWEFHRDAPAPALYANEGDADPFDEDYDEGEYFIYRMRSDKGRTSGSFYGYMEDLGFDLDWEYLCAIARANGIEDFDLEYYQSNPLLPELTEKLLVRDTLLGYEKVVTKDDNGSDVVTWYEVYQTELINPGLDEVQYYPAPATDPTGANSTEKFMNAMASIGVDCTWEIYGKIAFKNRNVNINGNAYEIEHALKALAAALKNAGNNEPVTYSPYSYFYNADGKNWWAEAIKGETDQLYPVINKYAFEDCTTEPFTYYGDIRNNYSTGTGLALDGKDYISGFRGLDVDMYTISFSICADQLLSVDTAEKVLKNIASGPSYFFSANTEDELTACMKAIVGSMSTAATRTWFTDTMGEKYDLYIGQPKTTYTKGEAVSTIKFYEYDVDKNGDRIGDPSDRETITLADMDGDGDIDAWSNRMFNTNVDEKGNVTYEYYDIWDETTDLITGKYVIYNASKTKTTPLTLDDSGLTYPLAPETFFWTIGMIGESEVVLEYQVYLEGSMEKNIEIPAGQSAVYDTNKEAVLHYINYLGNSCTLDTVPPAFPWGNPSVGYVFYLVDQNGTPLDSQGRTTDFAHSLKLSTAVYENLNTDAGNNTTIITASEKLAATDLAKGYQLYDPTASYTVVYDTAWQNNGGNTTYVTQYGSTVPSNAANSTAAGMTSDTLDLEKTVVYFALMVKQPDAGMQVGKSVEATTDANKFILTLDAYATGHEIIRPADIVLVLDHSGSMRTPVGAPDVLYSPDTETGGNYAGEVYTGEGQLTKNQLDTTLGQHRGYYVAQSTSSKWWFVLEYDAATAKWIGYSVPSTESIVNPDAEAGSTGTEHTKVQSWSYGELPDQLVYYKTQYAVLYDAIKDFVADLKNTGAEHRVALVGFAGADGWGSRLYVTENGEHTVKKYETMYNSATAERRTELYQLALMDVQNAGEYADLLGAIENIETNYSFTCPSAGLHMASDLFAANEINLADRDRIVVLFTDGIPNRKIDGSGNRGDAAVFEEIVQKAYTAKQQGAQIYSISTTTLGAGADRTFLSYASSDYPNATSYTAPGTAISPEKYTKQISSADALQDVFTDISESTTVSAAKIDETAVLKEVLSDYVQLDEKATVECEVFTQDYLGDSKWGELKAFTTAKVNTSPATGRVETIEVSGFDYAENYVSEKAHTDPNDADNTNFLGRRLVLKVYIESRTGFWGGNNVPTNKSDTAIYSDGKVVKHFPEPQVNVPIEVDVVTKDKTIYYSGTVDSDGDGKEGDELIDQVTIGGKDVTVNNDGTFTPQESWMDDFTNASWDKNSTTPGSDLSNTEPKDYTYTVVVTPNTDGTTNTQDNPSNIAGNIDGGTVEDTPSAETSQSDSDTGHVFIKVPELTFKDSTTDFGTSTDGYDYNKKDYVVTEWVFMEDTKDTTNAPAVSGQAPVLTLTYTPNPDDVQDGAFVTDTKVDVQVSIGDQNITDIVQFDWNACNSDAHTSNMNLSEHQGNADSNEFWVHVTLKIVPDTVVIDYGLDVVIDVLSNDPKTASIAPVLTGIGAGNASGFSKANVPGTYGMLSIDSTDSSKVRYTLNTSNGMQMNQQEVFSYEATYTIKGKAVALNSTVTVIPATTIYYEDTFVDFTVWDAKTFDLIDEDSAQWKSTGTSVTADQAQDRPGDSLSEVDADNIYGYDSAYTSMADYSMGTAKKVTVDSTLFAEAQFTFYGTGFDIISLTSNTTGTILVDVYKTSDFKTDDGDNYDATPVKSYMVDTYYGYKYALCNVTYLYTVDNNGNLFWERSVDSVATDATEEAPAVKPTNPVRGDTVSGIEWAWIVDQEANNNALYQIPVMKVSGLEYGQYTALITVSYKSALDHQNKGSYDFCLDAIRIYDPANDGKNLDGTVNEVIKDAYVDDGEGWPEYFELRNQIITKNDFDTTKPGTGSGIVFIDNTLDENFNKTYTITDYTNYGPNNEVYLAPGQAVAFQLNVPDDVVTLADGTTKNYPVAGIHLALKTVGGNAKVAVYDAEKTKTSNVIPNGGTIASATDLYYDITSLNGGTVVIANTSEAGSGIIVSITNIKVTHQVNHTDLGIAPSDYFTVNAAVEEIATLSLKRLTTPDTGEDIPEETVPEETEPEVTEPEETEPEVFTPEKFEVRVSDSTPTKGSVVVVTVTTSTDVDSVTVNGQQITKYTTRWYDGSRVWSTWFTADEVGEMAVTVSCCNADGLTGEAVTKVIAVSEKSLLGKIWDLIGGWLNP